MYTARDLLRRADAVAFFPRLQCSDCRGKGENVIALSTPNGHSRWLLIRVIGSSPSRGACKSKRVEYEDRVVFPHSDFSVSLAPRP